MCGGVTPSRQSERPWLSCRDNPAIAALRLVELGPYAAIAARCDTPILPVRPRWPRDKAKVEAAVLLTERWLLCLSAIAAYGLAEQCLARP
jgi:hypothetical protein